MSALSSEPESHRPTKTYEEMKRIGECRTSLPGLPVVSDSPIVSFGYFFCRGIVLYDGKRAGLSHIYPDEDPRESVREMMNELRVSKSLRAFLVEADKGNYSIDARKVLESHG